MVMYCQKHDFGYRYRVDFCKNFDFWSLNWIWKKKSIVFCYQNCSDLLWEKIDREKLLKFEAEGREFVKNLRSLEQFILTLKGHNNFW